MSHGFEIDAEVFLDPHAHLDGHQGVESLVRQPALAIHFGSGHSQDLADMLDQGGLHEPLPLHLIRRPNLVQECAAVRRTLVGLTGIVRGPTQFTEARQPGGRILASPAREIELHDGCLHNPMPEEPAQGFQELVGGQGREAQVGQAIPNLGILGHNAHVGHCGPVHG